MEVFNTVRAVQEYSLERQRKGMSVGLVPTMGALHNGHISLVKASQKDNAVTVASIFVNPIQFGNKEDLEKYPRTLEKDLALLASAGCDAVFAPSVEEMYEKEATVKISFGALESIMEGRFRQGHFSGVGVVVSKLFNIVLPNNAYFGQKDLQQYLVIKQLVQDLSFPVKVHSCPIIREEDGLAMSSRNMRLSPEARSVAPIIYKALCAAKDSMYTMGVMETKKEVERLISESGALTLEYFEVVDMSSFELLDSVEKNQRIGLCIAAYLDEVRLIDNVVIE